MKIESIGFNFIAGEIERESFQQTLSEGATTRHLLEFLERHAHPCMRKEANSATKCGRPAPPMGERAFSTTLHSGELGRIFLLGRWRKCAPGRHFCKVRR